jgi:hypothetical protein
MKNLYLFCVALICLPMVCASQVINIPDANFKARLLGSNSVSLSATGSTYNSTADTNGNGEIEVSEAAAVTGLKLHTIGTTDNDIFSLEGLQYFVNLQRLWCSSNQITSLDVSMMPQLKFLFCDENAITSLILPPTSGILKEIDLGANNLTSFNTAGLSNLTYLALNSNNINSINLSPLTSVTYLNLSNNPLPAINLSQNVALQRLFISNTLISSLNCSNTSVEQVFASACPNLTSINVKNGYFSSSDPDLLYFTFRFENLPLLTSICVDNGEQYNLAYTNYNATGNVVLYTGPDCTTVTQVPTMGVEESTMNSISLYPNPARDILNISTNDNVTIRQAVFYNTMGQVVKTVNGNAAGAADVSGMAAGIYLIEVHTEDSISAHRFIKN